MNSPLVSAIVPVHNAARYLRETLDSLCNQTLREIEIICVENGSTDESAAILQDYAALDGRIRIITLPPVGAGAARNKGIDEACGKYVSLHDADDLFEPDMLEVFYRRAEQYGADVVLARMDAFYEDGRHEPMLTMFKEGALKKVDSAHFCPAREIPEDLFELTPPWSCGKFLRRGFLNEHGIRYLSICRGEDVPFVFLSIYHAEVVSVVDRVFTHYRQHSDSLSHTLETEPFVFLNAYRHVYHAVVASSGSMALMRSFCNELVSCILFQASRMTGSCIAELCRKTIPDVEAEFHVLSILPGQEDATNAEAYSFYKRCTAPEARITVQTEGASPAALAACLYSLRMLPVEVVVPGEAKARLATDISAKYAWVTETGSAASIPEAELHACRFVSPGTRLDKLLADNNVTLSHGASRMLLRHTEHYHAGGSFFTNTPIKKSFRFFGLPIVTITTATNGAKNVFFMGYRIRATF